MLYASLRWTARMALRWYYREVSADGLEHVPADGPLLVVANHPNQLVDALLVGTLLPREVTFTGKAILLDNPVLAVLMRRLPFVPLRRAQDERKKREAGAARGAPPERQDASTTPAVHHPADATRDDSARAVPPLDPSRNADSFRAIHDALADGQAVLIFPEGISHHQPQLAPIKTGAARIALAARDQRGIRGLHILPVGLNFEDKGKARTRVLVRVGAPIALDAWRAGAGAGEAGAVEQLTREVDAALRAVTLNFTHEDDRRRVLDAARLLSGLFTTPGRIAVADAPLDVEHEVARRVEHVRQVAAAGPAALQARVARFEARLEAFGAELVVRRLPVADLDIDLGTAPGARFAVREGLRAVAGAPLALWGRVNHWLPLRLTQALARRTSRTPEDPAMHTIVLGLVLVLLFYLAQTALVGALAGAWWALAYVVSLPVSATWDFRFRDWWSRARDRVRAYRLLRRDAALRARLQAERQWLRAEAEAIEAEATAGLAAGGARPVETTDGVVRTHA